MVRTTTELNGIIIVNVADSTSIKWMRYEPDAQIITIVFSRGNQKQYHFPGITPQKFQQIKDSNSLGQTISALKKEMH